MCKFQHNRVYRRRTDWPPVMGFGSYAIPEPSTFILVAITGLAAFGLLRRNKK